MTNGFKRTIYIGLVLLFVGSLMTVVKFNKEQNKLGNHEDKTSIKEVSLILDWTPNTNHTGLYVAQKKGFWKKRGLQVKIITPPSLNSGPTLVGSGKAEFAVGAQEGMTLSREQGIPLVSIAAILQHNTSGFASAQTKNIKQPLDFEGKTYGGWGSPIEQKMINVLMKSQQADPLKTKFVDIGTADYFTAMKKDVDFAWIFYGWTGIEAKLRNEPLHMIYVKDYAKELDYYTPILMTNEKLIQTKPDQVRSFVEGAAEGYRFAIANPEKAANILLQANPELNPKLVKASQLWISKKYQDDAPRWGEQKREVWRNYGNWLKKEQLLSKHLKYEEFFTNEFLPKVKAK